MIRVNSTGNLIQGNFIGTDATGTAALGNSGSGVSIDLSSGNTLGGAASGAGNTIAFNGLNGVTVASGIRSALVHNSIFSNTGLGIDLGSDGVTANDPGDPDGGPNNLQNFPVLTSVSTFDTSTTVQGTLNSSPGTSFTIEFFSNTACDSSGFGEGQFFIGSTVVTTDSSGNASFKVTLPVALAIGTPVTSTATDPSGNTSEFSQCTQVQPNFDVCLQDDTNANLLRFNSTTGVYQFTSCGAGFTLTGTGTVTSHGGVITLQDFSDRRVLARVDITVKIGIATIQLFASARTFTITDRNIENNTCACP